MSGFAKIIINDEEIKKIVKKYRKIKKYMKSNYYALKVLDGSESIVTNLLGGNKPDE
jgi:hypothetical protein